jgi:hypothetical protein
VGCGRQQRSDEHGYRLNYTWRGLERRRNGHEQQHESEQRYKRARHEQRA